MKTARFNILFVALLSGLLIFSACGKKDSTEGFDVLSFSDDTSSAAELVAQANEDLNKIKVMYKKNEAQREDLLAAMNEKDASKVRQITEDLAYLINDGVKLGEDAIDKINRAQQMNVNSDFKEYLSLKEESLRKQVTAFESRRQALLLMRDVFGTNNQAMVEKAKLEFKSKEESFAKTMEESKEISKKANDLAKESAQRNRE